MNTIVSSESAWQPAYDGMANADDTRVPQCTEGIMELIKGITGTSLDTLDLFWSSFRIKFIVFRIEQFSGCVFVHGKVVNT